MRQARCIGVAALVLALAGSGCFGPFNLTRRLYNWNDQVAGNWEKEFMFLLLAVAPVYAFSGMADAIVFNSMEFWTGNNPVDPPSAEGIAVRTKRLVRGINEADLRYARTPEAPELMIEQFQNHKSMGSLRIQQHDGVTLGFDSDGSVLFTAQSLPDGGIVVRGEKGKEIARYPLEDVEKFMVSARRFVESR